MQFVIATSKTFEDLYWSNDDGWTALDKTSLLASRRRLLDAP
jgi:hypothetical protein